MIKLCKILLKSNNKTVDNSSWNNQPFNSVDTYNQIISGLQTIDEKQSLYYMELFELYRRSSRVDSKSLKDIQEEIDDLFTKTIYKDKEGYISYYRSIDKLWCK